MIKILLVFFLALSGVVSFSGTIDPNTPDEKYLEYGSKFPYVGLLIGRQQDDTPFYGSAVAHQDNIIITAAHLFEDYKKCVVVINNKKIDIVKIIIHKDFNSNTFGKHDIAVCLLSDRIGLDWYPGLYEERNEVGALCSMSGFGSTGNFITGVNKYQIEQRAGSNFVDDAGDSIMFCSPSMSHKKTELEFLIAPGDSGGGLFIGNKLAGIHSGLIENKTEKKKAKYGAVSAHTRVSVYNQWIQETIKNINK
jgi:hypothetical protein